MLLTVNICVLSPAYIPVQARRSLAHPPIEAVPAVKPAPSPQQAKSSRPQNGRTKVDWPPAVRQYVQRSFVPELQIPNISREEMEAKLKQVITDAAESDNLTNIDWEALPLPQHMIQNERNKLSASSMSPWA